MQKGSKGRGGPVCRRHLDKHSGKARTPQSGLALLGYSSSRESRCTKSMNSCWECTPHFE